MQSLMAESKELLRRRLREAVGRAQAAGRLPGGLNVGEIIISPPRDRAHGDLATNLAMVLAGAAGMPPAGVAAAIAADFEAGEPVARVETAGPGFINFHLSSSWHEEALRRAIAQGTAYGRTAVLAGQRIQVEFVSANPVGPLNVVNARAGALGDSLARVLAFAGAAVEREYYINDHGVQVELLGRSVEARCRELRGEPAEFPQEGYRGGYVYDLAREFLAQAPPGFWERPEEERIEACRAFSLARILASQRADLESYGIHYDRWFSERGLHQRGEVERVFAALREAGHAYEKDGAWWLRTTDFGDEKDRVLLTNDGRPTYLLADIAYHLDKLARGFDRLIDIWGPDHHGHVIRMKAALAAAGADPGRLEILIAQQVNLLRGGQPVKMSKRAGEFITLRELLDEVGNDAARFYFLLRSAESHLDFDLALAVAQSTENPVYYIQYAHARVASIIRQAGARGLAGLDLLRFPSGKLGMAEEIQLADIVALLPEVAAEAALLREPHRLTGYLLELAGIFHAYYNKYRVITEDEGLTHARMALVRAVQIAIANGLGLLGVSAPERM